MKLRAAPLAFAVALAGGAALAGGCGGGAHEAETRDGGEEPSDAGARDGTVGADGATAGAEDGGDAAPSLPPLATGRMLLPGPATLQGLTSDGFAVYSQPEDSGALVAEVISLDGTGQATIAAGTAASKALRFEVDGPVVFVWTNRGDRNATLTVWSQASGAVAKGGDIRPGRAAASSDGQFIAYMNAVDASTANLVVSPIGSSSPAFVGTLNAANLACWQDVNLAFSGASPRLVTYYCPGASTSFAIESNATDGSGGVFLSQGANLETIGSSFVVFTDEDGGTLRTVAPDDTTANEVAPSVTSFLLSNDQSTVAYLTSDDALGTSPVATAEPSLAVGAGGAAQIGAISRDHQWLLFASQLSDAGAGQLAPSTDVQLVAADGGAPRVLVPGTTSCAGCLADNFTPDMTYAMVIDPIDNSATAGGVGPIHAFPLDGGPSVSLGTNVWTVVALDGGTGASSRMLFIESTPAPSLLTGYEYEITTRSLDPADTPNEIARGAEWLALDSTGTQLVYSIPGDGALSGVWVAGL